LLHGLFDTDGTHARRGVEYSSASERLALDVQEIVRSCGGYAALQVKLTPRRPAYRFVARLPDEFNGFYMDRKLSKYRGGQRTRRRIESVVPEGEGEFVCIAVDAPDHLFMAEDFILT